MEPSNAPDPRMHHYYAMNHKERVAAIHRLAELGWSAWAIASVTQLSIEQVQRILKEPSR